jgi:hypothetical protein
MPDMTVEQLKARIAELEAAAKVRGTLKFQVSEKGGVSVYGLQRFPVTLYVDQFERLFAAKGQFDALVKEHGAQLKRKEAKAA